MMHICNLAQRATFKHIATWDGAKLESRGCDRNVTQRGHSRSHSLAAALLHQTFPAFIDCELCDPLLIVSCAILRKILRGALWDGLEPHQASDSGPALVFEQMYIQAHRSIACRQQHHQRLAASKAQRKGYLLCVDPATQPNVTGRPG